MKKIKTFSMVLIALLFLTSCGGVKVDETTLVINNKQGVEEAIVEEFSKDYYNDKDMKTFIQDRIDEYNNSAGSTKVSLNTYDVTDGKAKVNIKYDSVKDYARFNNREAFGGNITEALISEYDFDASFYAVDNGEIKDSISSSKIIELRDYNVLIIKENVNVKVPGNIAYVSGNVKVLDKNTAKVVVDPRLAADEESSVEASTNEAKTGEEGSTVEASTVEESTVEDDIFDLYDINKYAYIIYK